MTREDATALFVAPPVEFHTDDKHRAAAVKLMELLAEPKPPAGESAPPTD